MYHGCSGINAVDRMPHISMTTKYAYKISEFYFVMQIENGNETNGVTITRNMLTKLHVK